MRGRALILLVSTLVILEIWHHILHVVEWSSVPFWRHLETEMLCLSVMIFLVKPYPIQSFLCSTMHPQKENEAFLWTRLQRLSALHLIPLRLHYPNFRVETGTEITGPKVTGLWSTAAWCEGSTPWYIYCNIVTLHPKTSKI
jgi:hypothetical protein